MTGGSPIAATNVAYSAGVTLFAREGSPQYVLSSVPVVGPDAGPVVRWVHGSVGTDFEAQSPKIVCCQIRPVYSICATLFVEESTTPSTTTCAVGPTDQMWPL